MAHPKQADAIKSIKEHLRNVGPKDWESLEAEYPDVPKATLWRWIKRVRENTEPDTVAEIKAAAKKVKEVAKDVSKVGGMLPATPSPAYMAKKGAEAEASINFIGRINQLYDDAEKLRTFSLSKDGTIKIPMFFSQSIKLRSDLLRTGIATLQEIYDIRQVQAMHDAIIEAIGEESPDIQRKVVERLHRLNRERGITIDG